MGKFERYLERRLETRCRRRGSGNYDSLKITKAVAGSEGTNKKPENLRTEEIHRCLQKRIFSFIHIYHGYSTNTDQIPGSQAFFDSPTFSQQKTPFC
jgi:hypothetical protein